SDEFLSVTVESNVLLVRLRTRPVRVIANWLVISWTKACAVLPTRQHAASTQPHRYRPHHWRASLIRPPGRFTGCRSGYLLSDRRKSNAAAPAAPTSRVFTT